MRIKLRGSSELSCAFVNTFLKPVPTTIAVVPWGQQTRLVLTAANTVASASLYVEEEGIEPPLGFSTTWVNPFI